MTPPQSPYDILEVSPDASGEDVRVAYRGQLVKFASQATTPGTRERIAAAITAFEVLGDQRRRDDYDKDVLAGSVPPYPYATEAPKTPLFCERCRQVGPHLRFAHLYQVWSPLVLAIANDVGGVLCPSCRSVRTAQSFLFSICLGFWSFNGIFMTIYAIYLDLIGGDKPAYENARLLRHQGGAFLERGSHAEAITCFRAALRYERDEDERLEIEDLLRCPELSERSSLREPGLLVGQIFVLCVIFLPFGLPILFFLISYIFVFLVITVQFIQLPSQAS